MKKENLVIGKMYGNGKGAIREILAINGIRVTYKLVNDGTKRNNSAGKVLEVNSGNFANWAKYESSGFVEKECLKDWVWEEGGTPNYIEGKVYIGELRKNNVNLGIDTFAVIGEDGKEGNFHTDSDYFKV